VLDIWFVTGLGKIFRTTAFKLSLAYLTIFAIGAGLVLARVAWNMKTLFDEQVAQTVAAEITGLTEQYNGGGIRRLVTIIERRARQPGSSLYLLTTLAGEPLAGNVATLPDGALARPGVIEAPYQRVGEADDEHRALAQIVVLPGGFRLLVGRDLQEREQIRQVVVNAQITTLLYLAAIGTIGGLFVARRVLRRVDAMNATTRTIMAGDLSGRLPANGSGDELDRLAQSLNAMLTRIGELMSGLKEVSDNIAHDLKTPLTRLRNGAEQALRSASTIEEYRAALEKVIDESDGLIRVFNALLMIARAESGADREGMADFDAGEVARDVGELYEPIAEQTDIVLKVTTEPVLPLHGSRELIGQAVANLVDNALKYGMHESTTVNGGDLGSATGASTIGEVDLSAQAVNGRIEITVADHGPGIAERDRDRVVNRFVRLEGARTRPGSGLGLALAAAVAHLHHGALRLEDNRPGLRVVISLPRRNAIVVPPALLTAPEQRT
jgi:signal transduction histidine kinase